MATEYRDLFRREAAKATFDTANQLHERILAYQTDGPSSYSEDTGYAFWLDNNFTKASPVASFPTSRHPLFTLDDDLNPQMPLGENGVHFRHSSAPTNSDLDLLLVDNETGISNRVNWPKVWWDHSESSFTIRPTDNGKVRIEDYDTGGAANDTWLDISFLDDDDGSHNVMLSPYDNENTAKTVLVVDGDVRVRSIEDRQYSGYY